MNNYDASMNYGGAYPAPTSKSKKAGAALMGGLLGMTCYYLPISKDVFVNEAFRVTKNNAEKDMKALEQAAGEISKNNVSGESKILLKRLGVSETIDAIADKCKTLRASITDPATVKAMKADFDSNFKSYKKQASLMDTNTAKAMSNIKWNGFKWGAAVGAVLGLALSLVLGRDKP